MWSPVAGPSAVRRRSSGEWPAGRGGSPRQGCSAVVTALLRLLSCRLPHAPLALQCARPHFLCPGLWGGSFKSPREKTHGCGQLASVPRHLAPPSPGTLPSGGLRLGPQRQLCRHTLWPFLLRAPPTSFIDWTEEACLRLPASVGSLGRLCTTWRGPSGSLPPAVARHPQDAFSGLLPVPNVRTLQLKPELLVLPSGGRPSVFTVVIMLSLQAAFEATEAAWASTSLSGHC